VFCSGCQCWLHDGTVIRIGGTRRHAEVAPNPAAGSHLNGHLVSWAVAVSVALVGGWAVQPCEFLFEKFAESMKPRPMRPGLSVAGKMRGS
jgi:hypothetical protein